MSDPTDDRTLVGLLLARRGERAFDLLYDRHTPLMYGLALRLSGGDEREAAEIVHDAWVRAVERLPTFAWRAELSTWLCGIVVNRARELWRDAGRDAGPPIEDLALPADDARLSGTFDRLDLERALHALPPGYRHVLVLHDVEGYTHPEIAGLLGIAEGTSKSQLARARASMRRALAAEGG